MKNLSQRRFANKIGVSSKTISAYETGKILPPLKVLDKIASTYKIPILEVSKNSTKILHGKIINLQKGLDEIRAIFLSL
ncbi:helix-turn-helix transcriptional regulator [candidate division WWE3 bacterium]|nr:helix-turn-helix transcriptional regulator [candidate division WWE3 bacterium]